MNILQILPSLDVGGVETGTIDLAKYLVRTGHKAIVVSGGGRLVKELDIVGARHYTLPVGKKDIITGIRMVRALARIIRNEDIDIVHARSRVPALIAYIACRMTRRIFITTAHGYYRKHPLSEVMGWGRYVIVASHIMSKHMATDFGVPYDRLRLIPRGVDLERFTFRDPGTHHPQDFTIGMVARITPLKGHADFLRAAAILNRTIPNLKAVIIGTPAKQKYQEDLDLLVRRLGLARTVEFAGPTADVPAAMRRLDLLVSATTTPEAFGRAIVEAAASGVPVVATRVGGVVDIIEDGANGLLVPAADPEAMAEAVRRLYADRALRMRLAVEGRRRVEERFSLTGMVTRTVALYEEALRSVNILVIKISAVGDVILSIPSLRSIRARFPKARVTVLVGIRARPVLDRCPYIDDRIVCDLDGRDRGVRGLMRIADELRKRCFDIVIDLQNNRKSHLLAFLSLATLRYGYANRKYAFLLNKRIRDDAPYLNPIEHQFRVLAAAGIKGGDTRLEIWPSEDDRRWAERFLRDSWVNPAQDLVGINMRASARWMTKNWPPNSIAALCDRLAKSFNVRVILTGAEGDVALAQQVSALTKSKPIIAAGKTGIMELAALMRYCKAYCTPDSAPMHIAAALGVPCVELFGPTDPVRHAPPAANAVIIYKGATVPCAPCYHPHCLKNFACMRAITVDDVAAALGKFVAKREAVTA